MRGLFSKLFLVFTCSLLLIIASFAISYKFLSQNPRHEFFLSNLKNYADLLILEYENEPISSLQRRKSSQLEIQKFDSHSSESFLKKNFPRIKFLQENNGLSLARDPQQFVLKVNKGKENYIIYSKNGALSNGPLPFIVSILLSSLIILGTYFLVRKMFYPIHAVSIGVKEFSKGNFNYQIPESGSDEFKILILNVNEMAKKIRDMLNARKDLFLAIAHELKTPLASARLYAELIPANESQQKIINEISYMDQLINRLIDIEKNSDLKEIEIENIKIDDLMTPFSGVRIHKEIETLQVDTFLLRMILSNLIENAKQYGGDQIEIIFKQNSITVQDNGSGVTNEKMAHLTEPFYRVDEARSRGKGLGLGLYLVAKISRRLGYTLEFRNSNIGFEAKLLRSVN